MIEKEQLKHKYEDEKDSFIPTIEYQINLQRIAQAKEEFSKLKELNRVPFQELVYWFEKQKELATQLKLNDYFHTKRYKSYLAIDRIYTEVFKLIHNYRKNTSAITALEELDKIDRNNERDIVKWLIANSKKLFFSFKKSDNWKSTGLIILETEPSLVVNCSDFIDSFVFEEIYYKHKSEIMSKYKPTHEHYEQNGGTVNYGLKEYLSLHNMYLDLLK